MNHEGAKAPNCFKLLTLLTEQLNTVIATVHHKKLLLSYRGTKVIRFFLFVMFIVLSTKRSFKMSAITTTYRKPVVTSLSHCNFIAVRKLA